MKKSLTDNNVSTFIRPVAWLAYGLLVLAAVGLGYQALLTFNEAEVIIEWSTASELDTVGFHLHRGSTSEGPFTQITSQLIPPSLDPLIGGAYVFTDTNVSAGQIYFYQLEDVAADGTSTTHGPLEAKAERKNWITVFLAVALLGGVVVIPLMTRQPKT